MAVIKKPIRKILFYLSSFVGLFFVLITGLLLKNSQYNLSQLENKAKKLFAASSISLISSVRADVPPGDGCGDGDSGDDAGCGGSADGSGGGDGCDDG